MKLVGFFIVLKTELVIEPFFFLNFGSTPVFDQFLPGFGGFLLDQTGSWFPIEPVGPAGPVQFLNSGFLSNNTRGGVNTNNEWKFWTKI